MASGRRGHHESIDGYTESASGYQILCARGIASLISRPHLSTLLQESLRHPLTLISAPAGFGKTMLLSDWVQSLPARDPLVAWLSLDEEDNEPRLFWTYVLSALDMHQPERFTPLLKYLQSPQTPPLKYVLTAFINLLVDSTEHFLLILDDYHMITEQQVHTTPLISSGASSSSIAYHPGNTYRSSFAAFAAASTWADTGSAY